MATKTPKLPPRWVMRSFWRSHRRLYVLTGGRKGLRAQRPGHEGLMRLTTTGRNSGQPRSVMLSYLADGPNLCVVALNGVAAPDPAWLLNLRAQPEAVVDLAGTGGRDRPVQAREADGPERDRLWAQWLELDPHLDAYAAQRPGHTAVVVLRPR